MNQWNSHSCMWISTREPRQRWGSKVDPKAIPSRSRSPAGASAAGAAPIWGDTVGFGDAVGCGRGERGSEAEAAKASDNEVNMFASVGSPLSGVERGPSSQTPFALTSSTSTVAAVASSPTSSSPAPRICISVCLSLGVVPVFPRPNSCRWARIMLYSWSADASIALIVAAVECGRRCRRAESPNRPPDHRGSSPTSGLTELLWPGRFGRIERYSATWCLRRFTSPLPRRASEACRFSL